MKYLYVAVRPMAWLRPFTRAEGTHMAKWMNNPVMTIDDLAKYLKISTSTLYKLCAEGKVPGQKVGRHWRFHRTVIDRWLCGNRSKK